MTLAATRVRATEAAAAHAAATVEALVEATWTGQDPAPFGGGEEWQDTRDYERELADRAEEVGQ